jgi:hypothetical protein
MENFNMQVNLYSMSEALVFLEGLNLKISDTWLRKRMESANLKIYHIGKSDFVTETDLYRLATLPRTKRGPKQIKTKG